MQSRFGQMLKVPEVVMYHMGTRALPDMHALRPAALGFWQTYVSGKAFVPILYIAITLKNLEPHTQVLWQAGLQAVTQNSGEV